MLFCNKCDELTIEDTCDCKLYKYRHPDWTNGEWEESYVRYPELLAERMIRNYNNDDPDTSGELILEDPIEIINDEGEIEKWNGSCEIVLEYDIRIQKGDD